MNNEERYERAAKVLIALRECGDEWMDVLVIVCKVLIEHGMPR